MTIEEAVKGVKEPDEKAAGEAALRWDKVAKPLNSLGELEKAVIRIAGVQGKSDISIEKKAIAVMCADNGIVREGVTQTGQEVTAIVAGNMAVGRSCVCLMAAQSGADVIPVDVGMASGEPVDGVLWRRVARGTKSFLREPAMSREETRKAVETGIEIACDLKAGGCEMAGSGEMGIGNTTTSSAVLSVLLDVEPEKVTGRGAGLTAEGYRRKVQVIKKGLELHRPDREDPMDVLAKVGGLDLAALAGFYIGCGFCRIPVVLDGLITAAAALAATVICPKVKGYLLASHCSAEPAGGLALKALGLTPVIQAEMCLGEGTGAAAYFPLVDMAVSVYRQMSSFEEIKVDPYQHLA